MVKNTYHKPEIYTGVIENCLLLSSGEQRQMGVTVSHQSTNNIKGV